MVSASTVTVCTVTERCVSVICAASIEYVARQRNINSALQVAVIKRTQHLNKGPSADDVSTLELESVTEKLCGKDLRFLSNKHMLFAHQLRLLTRIPHHCHAHRQYFATYHKTLNIMRHRILCASPVRNSVLM